MPKTRLMFSANIDGKVNVWGLDLDHGYPYPMTTLGEDCGVIMPDPEGRYVIAAFDKDGDENWQVFAMPPTGGQLVELLVAEGEKFYPVDLSKDGRYLYYTTSQGKCDVFKFVQARFGNARKDCFCTKARTDRRSWRPYRRRVRRS